MRLSGLAGLNVILPFPQLRTYANTYHHATTLDDRHTAAPTAAD